MSLCLLHVSFITILHFGHVCSWYTAYMYIQYMEDKNVQVFGLRFECVDFSIV